MKTYDFVLYFLEIAQRGGQSIPVYCDHTNTDDVKQLFEKIDSENQGNLDILVNNAFSGAPVCFYFKFYNFVKIFF